MAHGGFHTAVSCRALPPTDLGNRVGTDEPVMTVPRFEGTLPPLFPSRRLRHQRIGNK